MNCQIRGLASIRKGLGTENTPFLGSPYSIIASEDVYRRVSVEIFKSPVKAIFANPEGSQFCQSGGVPILPIRRGPVFRQSGEVLISSIRRGPVFVNLEGSCFCQSGGGGVLFFQNLSGHKKVNSKRY